MPSLYISQKEIKLSLPELSNRNIATQINKLKVHLDSLYKYKDNQWAIIYRTANS